MFLLLASHNTALPVLRSLCTICDRLPPTPAILTYFHLPYSPLLSLPFHLRNLSLDSRFLACLLLINRLR